MPVPHARRVCVGLLRTEYDEEMNDSTDTGVSSLNSKFASVLFFTSRLHINLTASCQASSSRRTQRWAIGDHAAR